MTPLTSRAPVFAAIDFETASRRMDSACAVAIVRSERGQLVEAREWLIRPPRSSFEFSSIHGISWEDVRDAPKFSDVWGEIRGTLDGAEFLAAHNASFDFAVLRACCGRARMAPPPTRWVCTVQLARETWGICPTSLPDVCRRLRIPLTHHEPLTDASACARIVTLAWRRGARI